MEELSLDHILSGEQVAALFPDNEHEQESIKDHSTDEKSTEEIETTEVDPESLFGETPESVGSEDNIKGTEDTGSSKGGTSPNFYSSIANALIEDGIFQTFSTEDAAKINTAEDFAKAISDEIKNQFDERQKRIDEALGVGVEPSEVQKYERFLEVLNGVDNTRIEKESEEGENLRRNLIYQDYVNRGFSKERALREVERSFKAGTDIEDAKEALQSNKEYYKEQYNNLIEEAKQAEQEEQDRLKKQAENLRVSILDEKKAFGEIELDKATRQKVYDSIMKPIYTDPDTGEKLTAIQKYESENKAEFLKNVGYFYVLTDGFKNLDGLVKGRVKKEIKKGLRELEHTINSTSRTLDGNLKFISGVGDDPDSKSSKWDLDL